MACLCARFLLETTVGDEVELRESMESFKALCNVLDIRKVGSEMLTHVAEAPPLQRLSRYDFQRARFSTCSDSVARDT